MKFYKLQASGNDFILLDTRRLNARLGAGFYKKVAKKYCQRKFGVGADGLLVIQPSTKADFRMRIFNADGTEAEMCGNGARCVGLWAVNYSGMFRKKYSCTGISFESKAGLIKVVVNPSSRSKKGDYANVKVKLTDPCKMRLNLPLVLNKHKIKVNYVNTGVPHAVIFVQDLYNINVNQIGYNIRFHKKFKPQGANVDFVEVRDKYDINIRTYERGVEAETLACGTGIAASAVITCMKSPDPIEEGIKTFKVTTITGDELKVHFYLSRKKISDLWLEGKAYLVYAGRLNI